MLRTSRILADRLGAVEQHETAIPEGEAVHKMRVAVRRLRAALRLLRLRDLDPAVKKLQDALGDVRDLQLQVDWFKGRDERIRRSREARLRKAEKALKRELGRWRSGTLPALLEAAADGSSPPAREVKKVLRKSVAHLEERLDDGSRLTPRALHKARISVKQVRYLFELAKASLPRKARALALDLEALQATLGELHDVDVRIALTKANRALLREQQEDRERFAGIAAAQLTRWRKAKLAKRVRNAL